MTATDCLTQKELETYHTDPTKNDTDGDGVSDGDEIQNETDPNKADGAPGDVDGNGKVELADAVLALKIMAGIPTR